MVKIGGININSLTELNRKIEGSDGMEGAKAVLIKGKSVKVNINEAVKSEQRDKIIRAAITLAKTDKNLTIDEKKDLLDKILTKLNSLKPEASSDPAVAKAIEKRHNLGRILFKREEKIEKAKASLDKMEKKLLDEVQNSVKKQVIKCFKSKKIGQDDNSLLKLKLELENQYRKLFPALTEDSRNSAIEKGAHEAWDKVFKSGSKKAPAGANPIWPQVAKGPTKSQIERGKQAQEKTRLEQEEKVRREQEEAQRRAQEEEDRRAHAEQMEAARLAEANKKLPGGITKEEQAKLFATCKKYDIEVSPLETSEAFIALHKVLVEYLRKNIKKLNRADKAEIRYCQLLCEGAAKKF